MEEVLGVGSVTVPERLAELADLEKVAHQISNDPKEILKFL